MMNANMSETTPAPDNGFKVIEVVRDPDGVIAVVTEREKDGRVSFSIAREFTQGETSKRTNYLKRIHIAAIRRLLNDLEDRLELAEDRARAKRR